MTKRIGLSAVLTVVVLVGMGVVPLTAQGNLEYPEPRYPQLRNVKTAEDLLDIARAVVRRPSRGASLYPGYGIKPGQRALIVVDSSHDRLVVEAIEMAIREAGGKPDVFYIDYESFYPPMKPADGTAETEYFTFLADNVMRSKIFVAQMVNAVGEYDIIIHGSGGADPEVDVLWEKLPWQTVDAFLTGTVEFPPDLAEAIDLKLWEMLLKARKVRITDPEGTDISWTVQEGDQEKAMERSNSDVVYRGHIMSHPPLDLKHALDVKGVIAGTSNHAGVFPRIKVYIENNEITEIEAGGAYGENWKSILNKYKDIQWPGSPGPGMGWLYEVAIGTNPKAARPANVMHESRRIWSWERARTGIIHWGIGVVGGALPGGRVQQWAAQRNLPDGHFHIHTYFTTFEIETEDGEKIKVIDKGHLTALDDPEIRKLAAQYGDPDELLQEAWIPAVPGINVEGDYFRDYANNPAPWITNEHEQAYGDWLRAFGITQ